MQLENEDSSDKNQSYSFTLWKSLWKYKCQSINLATLALKKQKKYCFYKHMLEYGTLFLMMISNINSFFIANQRVNVNSILEIVLNAVITFLSALLVAANVDETIHDSLSIHSNFTFIYREIEKYMSSAHNVVQFDEFNKVIGAFFTFFDSAPSTQKVKDLPSVDAPDLPAYYDRSRSSSRVDLLHKEFDEISLHLPDLANSNIFIACQFFLGRLYDGAPKCFFAQDLEGQFIDMEHSCEDILEMCRDEILNATALSMPSLYHDDGKLIQNWLWSLSHVRGLFEKFRVLGSRIHYVIVELYPHYNPMGQTMGFYGVFMELPEREWSFVDTDTLRPLMRNSNYYDMIHYCK
jgi:DNA-binding ferritin-like protein (Dps family)